MVPSRGDPPGLLSSLDSVDCLPSSSSPDGSLPPSALHTDDAGLMPASAPAVLVPAWRRVFPAAAESDGAAWGAALFAHARRGSPGEVIREYGAMRLASVSPDERCIAVALSSCARLAELRCGRQIHGDIAKAGFAGSAVCQGSLLNMYAKCGRLDDARRVFDAVVHPDAVSWTAMIGGYVQAGRPEHALELFDRMRERGDVVPDEVALVTAITACVRLGRLAEARSLFMGMASPNCIAWNAMISGHAQNGHEVEALEFFGEMRSAGVKPTRSTLGSVLSAAANLAALDEGRQVHCVGLKLGLASNVYVGSSMISLYAKCRAIEEARMVFDSMPEKNLVIWNAMLGGYAQSGMAEASVELFMEMKSCPGLPCDEFTYVSLFGAAAAAENGSPWWPGRQLHGLAIKTGYDRNTFAGNSLIDMYCKCGDLGGAARHFELLPRRDVVSWNSLMVGQVHSGCEAEALRTFRRMRSDEGGEAPDAISLATAISVCSGPGAGEGALGVGEQAHGLAVKLGFESSTCVGSSLVDFYGKLGAMESARRAFALIPESSDSEVPINALLAGYVQNGDADEAVRCFRRLLMQGLKPSAFTFASVLPACAALGTQLHCQILRSGFLHGGDVYVDVGLLAAYLKSRRQEDAIRLLSEVPGGERGLVLWTAAISGHAQNGYCEEAISLFWEMVGSGVLPDQSALASAIGACADLASLWSGRAVHGLLVRIGFSGADEYTGSALVDLYAKCGEIGAAARAFEEIQSKRDATTWNAMIAGLAKNGRAEEALALFRRMREDPGEAAPPPDAVTFLAVLTACSHAGLVSEGRRIFDSMGEQGASPRAEHYACLVDLLGRGGHLEEAEKLVAGGMPCDADAVAWGTVVAACRVHGDGERGGRAAAELMKMVPGGSAAYLLLLQMCAERGDWEGAKGVREAMREGGVRKRAPGCSWISGAGGETSAFVAGDKFHPDAGDIYAALHGLGAAIRQEEDAGGDEGGAAG